MQPAGDRDAILMEERHSCHQLMFRVRARGVELYCSRCKMPVLYSWLQWLTMMLMGLKADADSAHT